MANLSADLSKVNRGYSTRLTTCMVNPTFSKETICNDFDSSHSASIAPYVQAKNINLLKKPWLISTSVLLAAVVWGWANSTDMRRLLPCRGCGVKLEHQLSQSISCLSEYGQMNASIHIHIFKLSVQFKQPVERQNLHSCKNITKSLSMNK